jgi:uncharacterized membrane protein
MNTSANLLDRSIPSHILFGGVPMLVAVIAGIVATQLDGFLRVLLIAVAVVGVIAGVRQSWRASRDIERLP